MSPYRKEPDGVHRAEGERPRVSAREVTEALRRTPLAPEDDWTEELQRDRSEDYADEPWVA